jgi:hypothetical protein
MLERHVITSVFVVLASVGPIGARAYAQPDLTGVWAPYAEPGQGGNATTRTTRQQLPFTEAAARKVAAHQALVAPTGDTPGGVCLGAGMPASMLGAAGYPMEIVQRQDQITIIYELHSEVRRVYFGPRVMPEADRIPGRNGHSTGRWIGDTLEIETTSLVEQVDQLFAHGDQARIVERYRLAPGPQGGRMLIAEMTLTDPAFYARPVTAERRWTQVPNGHLLPYDCAEESWRKRLEELEKKAAGR